MPRQPSRIALRSLVLLAAAAIAACAPAPSTDGVPSTYASLPTTNPASGGESESPDELPSGFPVLPGAVRADPLPSDAPGTIARWTSDQAGPVAYDFYAEALPTAGYPTTGLYPGGAAAIIAFRTPSGDDWELVLTLEPGGMGTVIDVRRAQP